MVDHIPFNSATLGSREFEYLTRAINGRHISGGGPFTRQAEAHLSNLHGTGRSLLTTSCTHALELSGRLLNLSAGDEVIVPAFTFVSTAAAFMMSGATPIFADVRRDTLNICPDVAENLISERTKAICIVHYAGVGADPDRFKAICHKYNLALIEDNAHGLGGTFSGQPLGTFGEMSTMSFHETKNVTCGEGGAIHLNDETLIDRAEILREKGTNRSRFFRGHVDKYTWVDVGSSWVISDMLAAVLAAQLERFHEIQVRRQRIWDRYRTSLCNWAEQSGFSLPSIPPESQHTAHMFYVRLDNVETRTAFLDHLKTQGVNAVFHYQPLHLSDVGRSLGGRLGQCPESERAADDLVRLPMYETLDERQQDRVITAVTTFRSP
jgi:dTDP-4-amino-4,6-dideoxygalactose transaminase